MKALLRTLLALLLLSAWGRTVLAQAIPDNIPDVPGESPADRARERLKERHRAELSRIFVASHIAVGPMSGNDGYLVDFLVQAGIDLRGGGALHAAVGSRSASIANQSTSTFGQRGNTSYLFSVGYDVPMRHLVPAWKACDRCALGLAIGGLIAGVGVATLDVGPKYVLPVNRYWSVPLGLKLSTVVLGKSDAAIQQTFLGLSIGARVRFAHRDRLK